MSIVILGHIDVHPDDVETVATAARVMVAKTQSESGCQIYALSRDVLTPNIFRMSEWWDDEDTLAAHLKQPHVQQFVEMLGKLRINGVDGKKYTVGAVAPLGV